MRYGRSFGAALLVVAALLARVAGSAYAVPVVSVALGGSSATWQAESETVGSAISSVSGEKIAGEGFLATLTIPLRGSDILLKFAKHNSTACESEEGGSKDRSGEVLLLGSWRAVYTSLSPLDLGVLFLLSPTTIDCGTEEVLVKGDALASINASELGSFESTEYTQLGQVLKGNGAGVPSLTTYYNEAGTAVKAKLEANFGTGFKSAAAEIAEQMTATVKESKMFVITSR
jgi:hypothetical protein